MTKEETLALIEKKRDELKQERDALLRSDASPKDDPYYGFSQQASILGLGKEIAWLSWAYDLVKQVEVVQPVVQKTPLPSGDQNTVATGWQAALTGELRKER